MKSVTFILLLIVSFYGLPFTCTAQTCTVDTIPPVVYCKPLHVNILSTGSVMLWASDFLENATDNCTPPEALQFAISRDLSSSSVFPLDPSSGDPITFVQFGCLDMGPKKVRLWAKDKAGNSGFCEADVVIRDTYCNCECFPTSVSGNIKTETGKSVKAVSINYSITPALENFRYDSSDSLGRYQLTVINFPIFGSIELCPTLNSAPLNGVSTLDLGLISKHILGIASLSSPYKIIAADANHSGSVTSLDIVTLRRLILGIDDTFPQNTSWRFVPQSYIFPNPANPFQDNFLQCVSVTNLVHPISYDLNFIGIKTGDVNGSVQSNALSTDDRDRPMYYLEVQDRQVAYGEVLEVHFVGSEAVIGHQFSLEYPDLTLQEILYHTDNMDSDNFGVFPERHLLTSSWNAREGKTTYPAFTLRFRALSAGLLSEMLHISDEITTSEAYGADKNMRTALRFGLNTEAGLTLYPNAPNPFREKTNLHFFMPEAGTATISLYDQYGRLILQRKGQFDKGHNTFTLNASDTAAKGILFYQIETLTARAMRKIIKE